MHMNKKTSKLMTRVTDRQRQSEKQTDRHRDR